MSTKIIKNDEIRNHIRKCSTCLYDFDEEYDPTQEGQDINRPDIERKWIGRIHECEKRRNDMSDIKIGDKFGVYYSTSSHCVKVVEVVRISGKSVWLKHTSKSGSAGMISRISYNTFVGYIKSKVFRKKE